MQLTLADFDLVPDTPLQTEPPTYLHTNDPPTTQPTLIVDDPIPEPPKPAIESHDCPGEQVTFARYCDNLCPVCHRLEDKLSEHVLVEHPEFVNDRLADLKRERDTPTTFDATDDTDHIDDAGTPEPAMFGEIPTETHGEPIANFSDPRACDDCGERMSKSYARIFADTLDRLYCPDCRSRSERYSNDDVYGEETHSDPESIRGSNNARSHDFTPPAAGNT